MMSRTAFTARSTSLLRNCSLIVLATAGLGLVHSASAQEVESEDETASEVTPRPTAIIVTGTRIEGIKPTGSPVVGVTRDDIQSSTASSTSELLAELPQVFTLGAAEGSYGSASNQAANVTLATGINLRGLGASSTLTLLDGRRLPPAGTMGQLFDPSVIPAIAIEQLEVLADGSSGIYGSDAVAGVVNILLRNNFTGLELSGEYAFADGIDRYQVSGIFGQSWGSGSAMIAGEYFDRTNLAAADRSFYTDDLRPFGGPDLRGNFSSPGTIVDGDTTYAIPSGQDGTDLTPDDFTAGTQNLQSSYLEADAYPSQERKSIVGVVQQDFGDRVSLTAQGFWAKRNSEFRLGPVTSSLTVPSSNPFFVNPADPDAESVTVRYSFLDELGSAARAGSQEIYWGTASLTADLFSDWSGELFFDYGIDKERSSIFRLNGGALMAALADPNPATAFNPFGDGSQTPQSTIDSIRGEFRVDTDSELMEYGVVFDGTLFEIPGGGVKTAFGASRIEETFVQYAPVAADLSRSINSLFGEVFVPLIDPSADIPGLSELNLSAAVRYDDYSDVGSTVNPKFGVTWYPVPSLAIRGSYGTSFKAPAVVQSGEDFIVVSDFVDPRAADGLTRVLFLRGPSDKIGPETAETYSFGFDYNPDFDPGLRISATYFNVDYSDRIASPPINSLSEANRANYASLITFDPSAELVNMLQSDAGFNGTPEDPSNIEAVVDARQANLASVKTDGIEAQIAYDWRMGNVDLRAGLNGTYILSFKQNLLPGTPLIELVNTTDYPNQFRARAYAGARVGSFDGSVFINHTGGYDNATLTPRVPVDSYTTVDVSLRYNVTDVIAGSDLGLFVKVKDLFDADPPYVQYNRIAFDSNVADSIGRMVSIGANVRF